MNLKLHEVINLYYELNGVTKNNSENGEAEVLILGILKQKISLKSKVYLQRLGKVVAEEVKLYEDARQELFKKYGDEKDGQITVPSENIAEFNKEHTELLSADKNIDVSALWGSDFNLDSFENVETDEFYPTLFSLIDAK